MDLTTMIHPDSCKANMAGNTKKEILENLADLAMKHPAASEVDRTELMKRIYEREEKGSTGIGSQLAIPHSEVPRIKGVCRCYGDQSEGGGLRGNR